MIDVAIDAARAAGELAYRYFKSASLRVSYKTDRSPVTRADIETEKLIRKIITKKFPDHGIIGEELPPVNPNAKYQWIIDPIDGTNDFVRRLPFWSTYLAVLEDSKPVIGIAFFPPMQELFVAKKKTGTTLNGEKTHVSRVSNLKRAALTHGAIHRFAKLGKLEELVKLATTVQSRRYFGSASLSFLLKGQVDIYLEPAGGIHDFAAPAILVEEAGGKFTDFSGKFSLTSGNAVATNGLLHKQVISLLNDK